MVTEHKELIYGVDDKPPLGVTLLLALQHMIVPVSYTVFAVLVVREIGGLPRQVQTVTCMALLASAVGVILQALKRGPVGSGFLVSHMSSAIYIPASLAAGAAGGLKLIWGMTIFAGVFEAVISRAMHRLRAVLPPEVCGAVVTMVGFSLVRVAVRRFVGLGIGDNVTQIQEVVVSTLTLGILVGLSVWAKGRLRLYCLMISVGVGYLAAMALGVGNERVLEGLAQASWFSLPSFDYLGWSFNWDMVPAFMVAALAAAVKASGLVITAQKINDPDWKRADMVSAGRGVLADALGTISAGLLGTIGTNLSPTSVGLTVATGATCRYIGFITGILVLATAFLPKVIALIALIPGPVMGAVLIYAVCVISTSGLSLIMSRMMDTRRTFVVGLSLLAGLSVEVAPALYHHLPNWAQLLFDSPITVTALCAVGLNLLFRIGVAQKANISLDAALDSLARINAFVQDHGATWGIRPETAFHAKAALSELWQTLISSGSTTGPVLLEAAFDEFNLDVSLKYKGAPLDFSDLSFAAEEIAENDQALAGLSKRLVLKYANKVQATAHGEDSLIRLHFEH